MPIYEYECNDCGHEFDALQKMSDTPLSDCPACALPRLRKKISAPGFRLSGKGWYETDFKADKQRNLSHSDSTEKDTKSSDKNSGGKGEKSSAKPSDGAAGGGKEAAA